jgi:16S rRNA (cytidine(1402)-2'-O)-methyltransferase
VGDDDAVRSARAPRSTPTAEPTRPTRGASAAGGAGQLVVVGTPIGNLGDLSPRAAEALAAADVIACEDTRHTGLLLSRQGIEPRRLVSVHEHNEAGRISEVLDLIAGGAVVALVSDAGMPVVSDPGARVVAAVSEAGHTVVVVPGPSAGVAAYAVSGLAASGGRHLFEGFLPRRGHERRERLAAVAKSDCPTVIYESPNRVDRTIQDLREACGADRKVAICRELTKLHEEVWRGSLSEAAERTATVLPLGEHVLVVDAAGPTEPADEGNVEAKLRQRLDAGLSRRDAVAETADELSVSRRAVYDVALRMRPSSDADAANDDEEPAEAFTWTDSHCHVHGGPEPDKVIERAFKAGVSSVICIGTDEPDSLAAIEFARQSDAGPGGGGARVFATVGLHPHDATQGTGWLPAVLAKQVPDSDEGGPVVGLGECGLDYHYDHSPRDVQRRAFSEQIELANRFGLPLVVHTREAWDDTFKLLRSGGVPDRLVFHCFSGGPDEAQLCIELGAYLSFSGIVTFGKADLIRAAAVVCPLDRLLVETDSPFLAPVPHRGKQNEPMWVPLVGAGVATAKGIDAAEVAEASVANAAAVFGRP